MQPKKIAGIIFTVLSVILAITILLRLFLLIRARADFTGSVDSSAFAYNISYLIGHLIIWVLQIVLVIILWKIGRKWIRKI